MLHHYLLPYRRLFLQPSYSGVAAVDLGSSGSLPLGSLCSSNESSAQQRVRRGKEERERLVHSGFKAPSPRSPSLFISDSFPRAHDPSQP
ncbi:hypothetical protein PBY51_005932 [Eleginops maclovinus]|uniref:Uncharacterized protein n=1 Tax=Eleginops maclovinus TaxID=56733 RepID=A0AAN7ZV08_ELEMC|nr:hypothetical protein PBY51_005932 [Eleginops maclovinus]